MRARSLKPALFKNEVLGAADPLYTLLFEGLWCEADREGRLEDRPLRLRAEIFPYRHDANVDAMLNWLADHGFIFRYEVGGSRVIQITKFSEHQRPHANEVASVLPIKDKSEPAQGKKQARPRKQALATKDESASLLILDTSSLTPDSGLHDGDTKSKRGLANEPSEGGEPDGFAELRKIYPKRAGSEPWTKAVGKWRARISMGATPADILAGARRYADFIRATGKEGTEFVMQAATFLGPDEHFRNQFQPPAKPETAFDEIQRLNGINGNAHGSGRVFEAEQGSRPVVASLGFIRGGSA